MDLLGQDADHFSGVMYQDWKRRSEYKWLSKDDLLYSDGCLTAKFEE